MDFQWFYPLHLCDGLYSYQDNILPEEETLDLEQDADTLYNKIRGLLPAPAANIILKGDKIKIYKASVSEIKHNTEVGKIINKTKKYFTISCGDNTALDIYELQVPGKRRMLSSDFINGGLSKYID
jgi:methionyl-tRNA formyltransferase